MLLWQAPLRAVAVVPLWDERVVHRLDVAVLGVQVVHDRTQRPLVKRVLVRRLLAQLLSEILVVLLVHYARLVMSFLQLLVVTTERCSLLLNSRWLLRCHLFRPRAAYLNGLVKRSVEHDFLF